MAGTNYFVCTLGESPLHTRAEPFNTVNGLISHQAKCIPDHKAVGFAKPSKDRSESWTAGCLLTFGQIDSLSKTCANLLESELAGKADTGETVALLCGSTVDFLLNWLGLIRLGHPVLLLAPQCTPDAVAHLCTACQVSVLIYDDGNGELMQRIYQRSNDDKDEMLHMVPTKQYDEIMRGTSETRNGDTALATYSPPHISSDSVAYLHHTSGTSSGKPKPVPQSHRAAVGALPILDGSGHASYTTTPLYHGGIADLFRAWTSGALIWMFPGGDAPITAENVVSSLDVCVSQTKNGQAPPVRYFSAVPYVLEILNSVDDAVKHLKEMDSVGVGGAALPEKVGEDLVSKGVPLVSRYGSAECGFIMSSHRIYQKDVEWQYLRLDKGVQQLRFEAREGGVSELIILPAWPHVAKTNREDGSYATSDLFTAHSSIPNAWKYHSRADSQLTLQTGKKFDPAPIEGDLASVDCLDDVLIVGTGKPHPAALIFRSEEASSMPDSQVIEKVVPELDRINAESQRHAQIPKDTLVPVPYEENTLPKSSKGTIIRAKAEQMYSSEIEQAYSSAQIPDGENVKNADISGVLLGFLRSIIENGESCDENSDLLSFGIDSVTSIRLRKAVSDLLPSDSQDEIPVTVVEDCGSIHQLSQFVISKREGGENSAADQDDDEELMLDLVRRYGSFDPHDTRTGQPNTNGTKHPFQEEMTVVLTGVTGSLGAHVLDVYRQNPKVTKIYCLVRGEDDFAAEERVKKAFEYRKLPKFSPEDDKVVIIQAKLNQQDLGMSKEMFQQLAEEATVFVHLAWAVNFRWKLRNFVRDHIAGLHNLLHLALASEKPRPPCFLFCSSTASVANHESSSLVPERVIDTPAVASSLGYSQSKWVAEQICSNANKNTRLEGNIAIVRVGQLSGASTNGIWSEQEAWPLLLSTVKITGNLPLLEGQPLDWLPVDNAAHAFTELSTTMATPLDASHPHDISVYHLINTELSVTWQDLLHWLQPSVSFREVDPQTWLEDLDRLRSEGSQHPALKLLDFWKTIYATPHINSSTDNATHQLSYETQLTAKASSTMQHVTPVDQQYVERLWRWIDLNIY